MAEFPKMEISILDIDIVQELIEIIADNVDALPHKEQIRIQKVLEKISDADGLRANALDS